MSHRILRFCRSAWLSLEDVHYLWPHRKNSAANLGIIRQFQLFYANVSPAYFHRHHFIAGVNLQGYETATIQIVGQIGYRNIVDPCFNPIRLGYNPHFIPLTQSKSGLSLRPILDWKQPAFPRLVVDASGPAARCRVYFDLVTMHSTILVLRPTCTSNLHAAIESLTF